MKKQKSRDGRSRLPWLISGAAIVVIAAAVTLWLTLSPPGKGRVQETSEILQNPSEEALQEMAADGTPVPSGQGSGELAPASDGGQLPQDGTESTEPTEKREPVEPAETISHDSTAEDSGITFGTFSLFSGQFVEDGRDEPMENVATILVTNRSDQYLDMAMLLFEIDGKPAAFLVTGLPAGKSAWVMEKMGLTAGADSEVNFLECIPTFREETETAPEEIGVTAQGNLLTVTNQSGQKLSGVYIYYKNLYPDGNYLGGITYRVEAGDLEPGASAEVLAGHYSKENSEIVRIEWSDEAE